jgi:APA family basic amino acid/polyamine antiporter
VHPRYQTPYLGLVVSGVGMLLFTVVTTFASAVSITVGLRVIVYIVTCAALPVLRRDGTRSPAAFRAPAGTALAIACVLVCLGLLASRPRGDIIQLAVVLALGWLAWLAASRRGN